MRLLGTHISARPTANWKAMLAGVADGSGQNIIIPDGAEKIKQYLFYQSAALVSVDIPESVASIEIRSFTGCAELESVIIRGAATLGTSGGLSGASGTGVFENCKKLKSAQLPHCNSIGHNTFYGCAALENIEISSSCTLIGHGAFTSCTVLEEIEIPPLCASIGNDAFSSCTSLRAVFIHDGVETIGFRCFQGCRSLREVRLPNTITQIPISCFYQTAIEAIEIPNGVKTIGASAFYGCTALMAIDIPSTVTSIGAGAFQQMPSTGTIIIRKAEDSISGKPWGYAGTIIYQPE